MKHLVSINDLEGAQESDLVDLEDVYMRAVAAKPDDDRAGHFHPSANGQCGRRQVYEYTRAPALTMTEIYARQDRLRAAKGSLTTEQRTALDGLSVDKRIPDEVRERDVLDFGHAVHDFLGKRMEMVRAEFEGQGWVVELEIEKKHDPATDYLRQTYGIGGTTDVLLTLTSRKMRRQKSVLEFKSKKDELFKALAAPEPDHLKQATIYAFRWDAPGIYVWYLNKDTQERKIYPSLFSYAVLEEVLEKYELWMSHVLAGTLPERDESFYMCPRCPNQHICSPQTLAFLERPARISDATKRGGFGKRTLKAARGDVPEVSAPKRGPLQGAKLVHLRKKTA